MKELIEIWRFREVLFNLVRRNLKVRYKNSALGFLWSLLNPLMQIGVWWLVFKVIWEMPEKNYTAFLITGFLPWLFFSQCVLDSTACVTQDMPLVKKAYFPRAILPISSLLSNLVHLALAFVVAVVLFAIWRVNVNIHYWLVIPSTLLVATFAYGISAMLAAWSVLYADVKFIVGNLLGLWFFLTPVLYPIHRVLGKQPTEAENWLRQLINVFLPYIKTVYLLDPITIGILGYRSGLLRGGENPIIVSPAVTPEMTPEQVAAVYAQAAEKQALLQAQYPIGHYIIGAAIVAVATAIIGHLVFRRLSWTFAEKG